MFYFKKRPTHFTYTYYILATKILIFTVHIGKSYTVVSTNCNMVTYQILQILKALGEKCKMFVIDEAHCLKTWGSGDKPFRKNFSDLAKCIAKLMVSAINSVSSITPIILNNVLNIVHNRMKPKFRLDIRSKIE